VYLKYFYTSTKHDDITSQKIYVSSSALKVITVLKEELKQRCTVDISFHAVIIRVAQIIVLWVITPCRLIIVFQHPTGTVLSPSR